MKILGEKRGIDLLQEIREEFRTSIGRYEVRAKSCAACETPGACCLDAHFVNVRISRLEAAAIRKRIDSLPTDLTERIYDRVENAIAGHGLEDGSNEKFACPLFEPGIGCLVHSEAKPLPCIAHACYEKREDLPPEEMLSDAEARIYRLNRRVYRKASMLMPLPVAVRNACG